MRRFISKTLVVAAIAGTCYLGLLAVDIGMKPPTTPAETERALAYATAHQKPLPLRSFYFDGCTAFPDRLPGHTLYEACLNHDIAYWLGGTEDERSAANAAFKQAVTTSGPAGRLLAPIMYAAVQYGGNNWFSRTVIGSNWGFGWNETAPWF